MTNVTLKDLDNVCEHLNRLTKSPLTRFTKTPNGETGQHNMVSNPLHFYIDRAYGGNKLVRVYNEGGGVVDVSPCGYVSKRECYELAQAIIAGVRIGMGMEKGSKTDD